MIHTVYSNSYEVLRVCLMNNIEALGVSTGGSGGAGRMHDVHPLGPGAG